MVAGFAGLARILFQWTPGWQPAPARALLAGLDIPKYPAGAGRECQIHGVNAGQGWYHCCPGTVSGETQGGQGKGRWNGGFNTPTPMLSSPPDQGWCPPDQLDANHMHAQSSGWGGEDHTKQTEFQKKIPQVLTGSVTTGGCYENGEQRGSGFGTEHSPSASVASKRSARDSSTAFRMGAMDWASHDSRRVFAAAAASSRPGLPGWPGQRRAGGGRGRAGRPAGRRADRRAGRGWAGGGETSGPGGVGGGEHCLLP